MSEAKIIVSAEDRSKAVLAGVKASLGQVQGKALELNQGFGMLGSVLGSAFAGLSFTAFVKSTASGIDALNDIKDATGASIENISALEDVALRTGTKLDTVTTSLIKLNQALNSAKPGSDAALALESIGLSAEALKREDPAEALRLVAVALSGFADDGNKARLTQELFGKSLREVAPLLVDLASQGKLVATVTTQQAEEAEKFNKQLAQLEKNSMDVARAVVNTLLPSVNTLFAEMRIGTEVFGDFSTALLKMGTSNPFRSLASRGEDIAKLNEELKALQDEASNRGFLFNSERNKRLQESTRAAIAEQEKLLMYYKRVQLLSLPNASYSNEGRLPPDEKPSIKGKIKPEDMTARAEKISNAQHALALYVHTLQEQIDKTADLTERQKALDLLKSLGASGEVPEVRELVLGLERKLLLLKQDEAIRKDIAKNVEAEAKATKDLDDAIYKYSGRLDEARKIAETTRLEAQLAAGVEYTPQELENIVKGIAGIKDDAKTELDEMDEMFKQFGRNVQDSLGSTIKSTLKGDFDNIGDLWANLLLEMAAQAAAAQIGKELFGDWFKGGSLGGGVGSLLGLIGIPGFAAGGSHAGGLRIVGEHGPELEATGAARIYNASQTAQILQQGSGGGMAITYAPVIQIDSRVDRAQALQETQSAVRQGQRELVAMLKAKGVL